MKLGGGFGAIIKYLFFWLFSWENWELWCCLFVVVTFFVSYTLMAFSCSFRFCNLSRVGLAKRRLRWGLFTALDIAMVWPSLRDKRRKHTVKSNKRQKAHQHPNHHRKYDRVNVGVWLEPARTCFSSFNLVSCDGFRLSTQREGLPFSNHPPFHHHHHHQDEKNRAVFLQIDRFSKSVNVPGKAD